MKKLGKNNNVESNSIQAYAGDCPCRCYCGCSVWYHPESVSNAAKDAVVYANTGLEM
ncbi:CLI_3235 family bacteriocin precursor [Clostridium felsineum]|uniref:CLI_3235 family bacteriocin precursor n=1 Tax=Clostridium felsineum TaxID=36839 RepID=UPI00098CA7C4|nr:CLI_3235 family bacteriocin precursor [Clostridium felsineum]MCR3761050.1 CLI_3235 family bacteriocin precursor [Clostridium felsineum]URZ04322.1 hypothetical protein CLAUR_044110 [Clostridium felsineum]URZ17157.1 hypothetical protein CLFE_032090 [Clostridium felsineum DSM 794]